MPKFLSDEFFKEVEDGLVADPAWNESVKNVETSIMMSATDIGQSFVLAVKGGATTLQKAVPGAQAEFTLEGTYEAWAKVARGEVDIQSAVLKGQLRFRGSITKILAYRDRFMKVAHVMNAVPKDF
jgi:putative sterol carrier protein